VKRSLAILMLLALVALEGCSAAFKSGSTEAPANSNWAASHTGSLGRFRDDRKSVERAVQLAADQRYFAALELLEPLRPKSTTTAPAEAAEINAHRTELQIRQEAEVSFWIAYCYEKLGRTADATALYGQVISQYAATDFSPMAKARMEVLAQP